MQEVNRMVSKNLSTLRRRARLTQEQLAEQLHVTRQAVSNWETGKCQPDVETLTALSAALQCDVTELIYGAKPVPYRRYDKCYIVASAVLGAVVLLFFACELWLVPYLNERVKESFDMMPRIYYLLFARPLGFAALGALFLSALSLLVDLRLPRRLRIVLLSVGILCFVPVLLMIFSLLVNEALPQWWSGLWHMLRHLLANHTFTFSVLPFLGAMGLFLGISR